MIEGLEKKTVSAPREHNFTMQSVGGQMLTVFTENSSGNFQFSIGQASALNTSAAIYIFCCECPLLWIAFLGWYQRYFLWFRWWQLQSLCFLLYSSPSSCTFACLCCLFLCCEIVHILYTRDVRNRLLFLHHCWVKPSVCLITCLIYTSGLVYLGP